MDYKTNKGLRLLKIYERLKAGQLLNKEQLAIEFDVTPKSIQRDIDDLRAYIEENEPMSAEIVYDRTQNGYILDTGFRHRLSNQEVLALSKILIESRAFNKSEMQSMIDKLIDFCVPERDKKSVMGLIANEKHNYIKCIKNINKVMLCFVCCRIIYAEKGIEVFESLLSNITAHFLRFVKNDYRSVCLYYVNRSSGAEFITL